MIHAHEQPLADHVVERLEGEIRIDRPAAVADERGKVVHLARLAGFQHEADAGAFALADQMVMQPGHREQRRNGRALLVHAAVTEDEDVHARGDRAVGLRADFRHRLFQTGRAEFRVEKRRDRHRLERALGDVLELRQLLVREDRGFQLDEVAALRRRLKQVALAADGRLGGGHDLLADAVNGRVRDLREELLEVVVEQLRFVREHRQRDVRAHRARRLHAVLGHRHQQHALVFKSVTKGLLLLEYVRVRRQRNLRRVLDLREIDHLLVDPLAIRLFAGDAIFDLVVRDDPPGDHVHEEHAARLEAALDRDPLRRDRQHAGLRAHDHEVILRHVVARGAQAVAVERRADHRAIGENDRRRAVPRLHQAGVVFVERLLFVAHRLVSRPRLRDHHHHRVRQRAAAHDEQLKHIVEHRRVRAVRVHDRQDFRQIVAEKLARQQPLPRLHPVHIAPQRVDLAVVRDVAVRVRPLPTREGIRRKPRMHQRQRRVEIGIGQIFEIRPELHRIQHPFVNDRAAREARRVPKIVRLRRADFPVGTFADDVELALECLLVRAVRAAGDEHLPHERLGPQRRRPERGIVRRQIPPAQHPLPLLGHDFFKKSRAFRPLRRIRRREKHPHAILPRLRQRDALDPRDLSQKLVRHLNQNARAVTRVHLAPARPAMIEIHEDRQRLLHDLVRTLSFHLANKPDAARVMFKLRIVKSLLFGKTLVGHCVVWRLGKSARVRWWRASRRSSESPTGKHRNFPRPRAAHRGTVWCAPENSVNPAGNRSP